MMFIKPVFTLYFAAVALAAPLHDVKTLNGPPSESVPRVEKSTSYVNPSGTFVKYKF
jgi:hypothetical protein